MDLSSFSFLFFFWGESTLLCSRRGDRKSNGSGKHAKANIESVLSCFVGIEELEVFFKWNYKMMLFLGRVHDFSDQME